MPFFGQRRGRGRGAFRPHKGIGFWGSLGQRQAQKSQKQHKDMPPGSDSKRLYVFSIVSIVYTRVLSLAPTHTHSKQSKAHTQIQAYTQIQAQAEAQSERHRQGPICALISTFEL